MIYAAQTKATDNAINVGAYTNKPLIPIRTFGTLNEMRTELDRIWAGGDGDNLIRVSRTEVVKWFGKNFGINEHGECCTEYNL